MQKDMLQLINNVYITISSSLGEATTTFLYLATDKRRFLFLVVLLLHIIEYKEPFIYMYALPFTIYILAYYENVDLCKDSIIKNE